MRKCDNCGQKFKYKNLWMVLWKEEWKKTMEGRHNILKCENCGKEYDLKIINRTIFYMLLIIPVFMTPGLPVLKSNLFLFILTYLVYLIPVLISIPHTLKFTLTEVKEGERKVL